MFDSDGMEHARAVARRLNDEWERERSRREFWDGFSLWLACLVFGPCYVFMVLWLGKVFG